MHPTIYLYFIPLKSEDSIKHSYALLCLQYSISATSRHQTGNGSLMRPLFIETLLRDFQILCDDLKHKERTIPVVMKV